MSATDDENSFVISPVDSPKLSSNNESIELNCSPNINTTGKVCSVLYCTVNTSNYSKTSSADTACKNTSNHNVADELKQYSDAKADTHKTVSGNLHTEAISRVRHGLNNFFPSPGIKIGAYVQSNLSYYKTF